MVLVLAKLTGMTSLVGASDWVRDQEDRLREHLKLSWKRMPCANTYKYAPARLDSQQITEQFRDWLVRYEVQTGIVLHQCPIAEKRNEVSVLKPRLSEVLCKGRILTADAAQSYHEFGRLVKRAGGDFILSVKDNTPVTRADLELFFEDPQADQSTWHSYEQMEKGHGRLERRHLLTTPDRNRIPVSGMGRGRPVWRSGSLCFSDAGCAQFPGPFPDGSSSGLQCGAPDQAFFFSS